MNVYHALHLHLLLFCNKHELIQVFITANVTKNKTAGALV